MFDFKKIIETIFKMGPAIYPIAFAAGIYLIVLIILVIYYSHLYIMKIFSRDKK